MGAHDRRVTIIARAVEDAVLIEIALPRQPTRQAAIITPCKGGYTVETPTNRAAGTGGDGHYWPSERAAYDVVLGSLLSTIARALMPGEG
jgi:hypothetical protein